MTYSQIKNPLVGSSESATDEHRHVHGADYDVVKGDYFSHRQLNQGTAGWFLIAALGVSTVIAGDFAIWNYGIKVGGWGGAMAALLVSSVMYFCMIFSLAELAAIVPTSGGGYGFARRAFGPLAGYVVGISIVLEYVSAAAAIAVFLGAYVEALLGIKGWQVTLSSFVVFALIHSYGVGQALKSLLVLTGLAGGALLLFYGLVVTHFDINNLLDIKVNTDALGANLFFTEGIPGVLAALPFVMGLFLGVECVPLASEEAANPQKNIPRGMIAAIATLLALALMTLVILPAGVGSSVVAEAGDAPLNVAIIKLFGEKSALLSMMNVAAIVGLAASLFSVIYAFSRQIFSLSRAGYLPRFLSHTNERKSPYPAIVLPCFLAFALTIFGNSDNVVVIMVFCATLSYIFMMAAHIRLRVAEPKTPRPYKTPGGVVTSSVALALSVIAFVACFVANKMMWNLVAVGVLGVAVAYFLLYSRHHLIAQAPEEEFEALKNASAELE